MSTNDPIRPFRVGMIGIQPGRSWGAVAHVPALAALDDYQLVALSTTRKESAAAAAQALGVPHAFDNAAELVTLPDVDVVAVTVKVPHHLELVTQALDAGKHVYCEWPLGNGLDEATRMADHVKRAGVRGAIGLQARSAPVVDYVRKLVQDGWVGEVLSTTLIGSGMVWGSVTDTPNAYTLDKANGATMLTIPFGHTVDALCSCLGEFTSVQAMTAIRIPNVTLVETGEVLTKTAPDQLTVFGTLENGAVVNVHYRGGIARGTNLLWEIDGTEGTLRITADSGHGQISDLSLFGARGDARILQPMPVPAESRWAPAGLAGPAVNVAQAYMLWANDIRHGTRTCPDFDDAVRRHRLIAAIEEAVESGCRVRL